MTDEQQKDPASARILLVFGAFLVIGLIYIAFVALQGSVGDRKPFAGADVREQGGVDPALLVAFESDPSSMTLIDARSPEEYSAAHIPGAINIPHDGVEGKTSLLPADKQKPIVVHCKTGRRAGTLKAQLDAMGYADVRVLPAEQMVWGADGPTALKPNTD